MQWFNNLKTAVKLALSFGLILALMVVVSYSGSSAAQAMKANQEATYSVDLETLDRVHAIVELRLMIARRVRDGIIQTDGAKIDAAVRDVDASEAKLMKLLDELQARLTDDASRRSLDALRRAYGEYSPAMHEAIAASPRGDYKGDIPRMYAALDKGGTTGTAMDIEGAALIDRAKENAKARAELTDSQYARSRTIAIILTLGVLVLGVFATWLISRAIATPLGKAVQVLEQVAQGDLTARLSHDARDEVGQLADALDASLGAISATLQAVQETSQEVSAAASQLSASAEHISSGAQEQAASLEETAASLEEISSTVKQNTDSAQHAAQLASGARDTAERGGQVVESAVAAMTEITKSSRKIAEIITTIDEIAFQTNLLALNAAVEAARAGDQGRGFGVVAAEVRSLAQRTGSAAKDIRVLIADSTNRVEVGTAQVNQSGQTLDEIVKGIKRVTDMVAEIAAASREQSTGVEQVNTAVTQVDQVTQLNAAQTEELSATANGLSDKAVELQQRVSRFRLGGAQAAPRAAAPARSAPKPAKAAPRSAKPAARVSQPPQLKVVNGGYEEF